MTDGLASPPSRWRCGLGGWATACGTGRRARAAAMATCVSALADRRSSHGVRSAPPAGLTARRAALPQRQR